MATPKTANLWLPHTKLSAPRVGEDVLARPRLLARVERSVRSRRLTLLSAPPGSGKTTLLASLSPACPDMPLAWVTLDEDDNDGVQFFRLMLAGLQRLLPQGTEGALTLLQNGAGAKINLRQVAAALVNDLLQLSPPSFVLVLDDLHLLTDETGLRAFEYLVDYLPPAVHLLAGTRYDPPLPLARWRARGYLAEIRLDHLRFDDRELSAWLNGRLHLDLDEDLLKMVGKQTEGWAAGIHLLALSLTGLAPGYERGALLSQIGQGQRDVYEFLMEEVLQRQESELRQFLLETSILSELTPALCRAVTGRVDAAGLLDEIYRRNLFISMRFDPAHDLALLAGEGLEAAVKSAPSLEGAGVTERSSAPGEPSYRYHALFAQFLTGQLHQQMPERLRDLHRRAAEVQANSWRAVRHYLDGELWEEAAQVLETMGKERLEIGHLGQVEGWIQLLPAEIRQKHPWFRLLMGGGELLRGAYDAALPQIQAALSSFEQRQDGEGETEALVQLSEVYTCLGDVRGAGPILDRLLVRPLPPGKRIKAQINRAWIAFYLEDWPDVDARLEALVHEVMAGEDRSAYTSLILSLGPQYAFAGCGPECLESLCRQALKLFPGTNSPLAAGANAYLAYLAALKGDFTRGRQLAELACGICTQLGGSEHLEFFSDHALLYAALHNGDLEAFNRLLPPILERVERVFTYRQMLPCYLYLRMRGDWLAGDLEAAVQLAGRVDSLQIEHELPEGRLARQLIQALALQIQGMFDQAEAVLKEALPLQAHLRHSMLMSHARAALASLYWAWGRPSKALEALSPLLAELEQRQMPGVLAQEGPAVLPLLRMAAGKGLHSAFLSRVCGLLPEPSRLLALEVGAERLSEREVEVLRLVAEGLSNAEIAGRLYITSGTAKRHTINIYQKLGVNSRTQAVARARQLGWL